MCEIYPNSPINRIQILSTKTDLEVHTEKPVSFAFREPAQIDPAVIQSTLSDTLIMGSSSLNARKDNTGEDNINDSTKLGSSGQSISSPTDYTPPVSALEDNIAFISPSRHLLPRRIQNEFSGYAAQFRQWVSCKENIAKDKLSMGEIDAVMAHAHRQLEEKATRLIASLKSFEEEIKDGMETKHATNKAEEKTEPDDEGPPNSIEPVLQRKNALVRELSMNALPIGHVVTGADSTHDMDEEQKVLVVRQMMAFIKEVIEELQKLINRDQSRENQYQSICKQQQFLDEQQQSLHVQQRSLHVQQQSLDEERRSLYEKLRSFTEQERSLVEDFHANKIDDKVSQLDLADKPPTLDTKENRKCAFL